MNVHRLVPGSRPAAALGVLAALCAAPAAAQRPARVVLPDTARVEVGDTLHLAAAVYDSAGNPLEAELLYFAPGRGLPLTRDGRVTPTRGGTFQVWALVRDAFAVRAATTVVVPFPPVTDVAVHGRGERFYVGATARHTATVRDAAGMVRHDVPVRWTTSDPAVATVTPDGLVKAHREGPVTVEAAAEGVAGRHRYRVAPNPVRTVTLRASADSVRAGDVVRVVAEALDDRGRPVPDAPTHFTLLADPARGIVATSPPAEIDQQGRFVAEQPGTYTVVAVAPGEVAHRTIRVTPRHVRQDIRFVGHGAVRNAPTSDLWVWQGVDGRDYAVTGTWGAHGAAYFWDVTDPAAIVLTDSVVVDARTVNDVKVSEDGRICVITREGASNRRNGLVILDCSDPRDVEILSTFDEGLTGGVHNVFIWNDHVFAVNNGRRYDILNIEDPRNPYRVAVFELDTPGHGVHDVWVVDGIAYSSNWQDGVVLVDVGNGIAGGSPSNPVRFAQYADFGGATHAAFPYRSATGRFYVLMGDEIGRDNAGPKVNGRQAPRTPEAMAGYIHFVDFTDPLNPEEVARYEIPEAGSHNFWIEGDRLYAAFYNGGLRVLDLSGELKGDLGRQGREIARFMAYDPEGYVPNAPFTWGPQLYKGHIFLAEHYSGLWAVQLVEPQAALTP